MDSINNTAQPSLQLTTTSNSSTGSWFVPIPKGLEALEKTLFTAKNPIKVYDFLRIGPDKLSRYLKGSSEYKSCEREDGKYDIYLTVPVGAVMTVTHVDVKLSRSHMIDRATISIEINHPKLLGIDYKTVPKIRRYFDFETFNRYILECDISTI